MKLKEFHIDQFGAGVIRQGMTISSVLPTVACDFVGSADPAGRQNNRFRLENPKSSPLAIVRKETRDAIPARIVMTVHSMWIDLVNTMM
jgi:hypothetical protein